MRQVGVGCTFLMIVGYITETEKEFQETVDMFERLQPYAGNAIKKVALGTTLGVLPGTPLDHMIDSMGIQRGVDENTWVNVETGNDLNQRLHWRDTLVKKLYTLGYQLDLEDEQQEMLNGFIHK